MTINQLPTVVDSEQWVISSIFRDPPALSRIPYLEPSDFSDDRHVLIFEAIQKVAEKADATLSLATVRQALGRKLDKAGGDQYLLELSKIAVGSSAITHHGKLVLDNSRLRTAYMLSVRMQAGVTTYDGSQDVDGIIEGIESEMFEITSRSPHLGTSTWVQATSKTAAKFKDRFANGIQAIPTGIEDLDKLWYGGPEYGDMVVVGGRPSMGKTSLALSIVFNAANNGKKVAIFSPEMTTEQLTERIWQYVAGIPKSIFKDPKNTLNQQQFDDILEKVEKINLSIMIDDTPLPTLAYIKGTMKRMKAQMGRLDIVVIDYIQLIANGLAGKGLNSTDALEMLANGFKALIKSENVVGYVLSQLSRDLEKRADKRPMLSDLRGSGGIEQAADKALLIYKDEVYNPDTDYPGIAELIAAKDRTGGGVGVISCSVSKTTGQFIGLVLRTADYAAPISKPAY